jgi:hypothetical protein
MAERQSSQMRRDVPALRQIGGRAARTPCTTFFIFTQPIHRRMPAICSVLDESTSMKNLECIRLATSQFQIAIPLLFPRGTKYHRYTTATKTPHRQSTCPVIPLTGPTAFTKELT